MYRKEEKIVGMALLQNKLVYSVNLSIVFPQNHRHCKAFMNPGLYLLNNIGGMIKTIWVIIIL